MIYEKKKNTWEEACQTQDTMNIAIPATAQFIKSHLKGSWLTELWFRDCNRAQLVTGQHMVISSRVLVKGLSYLVKISSTFPSPWWEASSGTIHWTFMLELNSSAGSKESSEAVTQCLIFSPFLWFSWFLLFTWEEQTAQPSPSSEAAAPWLDPPIHPSARKSVGSMSELGRHF